MVLGVEVLLDSVSNSEEVGHVDSVRDVSVEVILEVLEHVHVVLNESVSSHSWEGEGGIVKLPCVDMEVNWSLGLLGHGSVDVDGVNPVSRVESSGEKIHLVLELFVGLIEVNTWGLSVELDEAGLVVEGNKVLLLSVGRDNSEGEQGNSGIFHYYFTIDYNIKIS